MLSRKDFKQIADILKRNLQESRSTLDLSEMARTQIIITDFARYLKAKAIKRFNEDKFLDYIDF